MENRFVWKPWNLAHAAKHGITRDEVEYVVDNAFEPFPCRIDENRFVVWGWSGSRYVQVSFVLLETLQDIYIIHARPLTKNESQQIERSDHGKDKGSR